MPSNLFYFLLNQALRDESGGTEKESADVGTELQSLGGYAVWLQDGDPFLRNIWNPTFRTRMQPPLIAQQDRISNPGVSFDL